MYHYTIDMVYFFVNAKKRKLKKKFYKILNVYLHKRNVKLRL